MLLLGSVCGQNVGSVPDVLTRYISLRYKDLTHFLNGEMGVTKLL